MTDLGWLTVPLAMLAGAIRVSTPFLFVSLGELLTEKSGRINLGLEGTLVFGAMSGYGASYLTVSPALAGFWGGIGVPASWLPAIAPWLGVLAAALCGAVFGAIHGFICKLPRVNDIAIGIAMMLFGVGLAFFLGKPLIQPQAPHLPLIPMGGWSDIQQVQDALVVNPLFLAGIALAVLLWWGLRNTRWGLIVRMTGDSASAARAIGTSVDLVRFVATTIGGAMAGIGGAFLSLSYPGLWSEGLSSGQGLMAVALVIFARWNPLACMGAALLFGAAGALGPALQSIGVTQGYYFYNAAPYVLTLIIMIVSTSPRRSLRGAPGELTIAK